MAEQTFTIEFEGYWREEKKSGVPAKSGIYCVYTCEKGARGVILQRLIYIGESGDVNNRLANHNHQNDFENELRHGENLCYSFSAVNSADRERCEAALINYHQPTVNTEHKDSFNFDKTTLNLKGDTKFLETSFSVSRTAS